MKSNVRILPQLRDNSIEEEGVLSLTSSLRVNTVLADLDLKLNQPGLQGEIALYQMLQVLYDPQRVSFVLRLIVLLDLKSRPGFELIWKDKEVLSPWSASQCREIINYFGVENVLSSIDFSFFAEHR